MGCREGRSEKMENRDLKRDDGVSLGMIGQDGDAK